MVKWMIPSIEDGDWFPSATEMDQIKNLFSITENTLREEGSSEAHENVRHAMMEFHHAVEQAGIRATRVANADVHY